VEIPTRVLVGLGALPSRKKDKEKKLGKIIKGQKEGKEGEEEKWSKRERGVKERGENEKEAEKGKHSLNIIR